MARSATERPATSARLWCGSAAGSITVVFPPGGPGPPAGSPDFTWRGEIGRADHSPHARSWSWPGGPGCRRQAATNRSPIQRQPVGPTSRIGASERSRRDEVAANAPASKEHQSQIVVPELPAIEHRLRLLQAIEANTSTPHGWPATIGLTPTPNYARRQARRAEPDLPAGSRPSIGLCRWRSPRTAGHGGEDRFVTPVKPSRIPRAGLAAPDHRAPGLRMKASGGGPRP